MLQKFWYNTHNPNNSTKQETRNDLKHGYRKKRK